MSWMAREARKEGRYRSPRGAVVELWYPKDVLDESGFYNDVYAVSRFIDSDGETTVMLGHVSRDAANYILTRDVDVTKETDS